MTSAFKKSLKSIKKRGKDIDKLEKVVDLLQTDDPLPEKYRDHSLSGNWSNHRELHIEPDWLLIYYKDGENLILTLVRTGTHSDLF